MWTRMAPTKCRVGQANRDSGGASVAATRPAGPQSAEPRLIGLRSPTRSWRDLDPPYGEKCVLGHAGRRRGRQPLHQPGHVPAESFDGLQALGVAEDFALFAAEGHVPVARTGHDHLADQEEVIELREGEVLAGAAGHHDCRPDLPPQQFPMRRAT